MVIDELITLIRFDMPGTSAGTLKKAEGAVSSLTKRVRDLGIVSMATGALTAALGINAANEANDLQRASEVTGLTIERLQQIESVYKSVGGSAQNAAQDAEAFFRKFGRKMDDKALEDLRSIISGLPDELAAATLAGAGFSDDIRRVIGLGDEEFQRRMQYAADFHSLNQQEQEDLRKTREAWVAFGSTAETVSERIQAEISPAIIKSLTELTGFLNENADAISVGVRKVTDRVVDLAGRGSDAAGEVIDVVKPLWDVFDAAVDKYVGWEDAIAVTVAALAGFSGLATIATVTKGVLGLAGAITGVAAAGSSAALVLGAGGTFVAAIIAANAALESFRSNVQGEDERIAGKIKGSESISELNELAGESFSNSIDKAITGLYSNGGFGMIAEAVSEMWSGNKEIQARVDEIYESMSPSEKYLTATDTSGRVDPAMKEELNAQGWGDEIYRSRALKEMQQGLASPRYMTNNSVQNNPNVTVQNEININGVRNAEQVAPAVGQAAGSAVQSAFQSNYKLAVPDGSIVHG